MAAHRPRGPLGLGQARLPLGPRGGPGLTRSGELTCAVWWRRSPTGRPTSSASPRWPTPWPGPEDVLVDVVATALNRADLLQRRGLYPSPPRRLAPPAPEIPGMELSGPGRRRRLAGHRSSVGDEVMAIVEGGAYAERLAVHERQVMGVPTPSTVADAAAIPEVGITAARHAWSPGRAPRRRLALVHAGGSGVGTIAIQIVKAMGARERRHRVGRQGRRGPGARRRRRRRLRVGGLRGRAPGPPPWAGRRRGARRDRRRLRRPQHSAVRIGGTIVHVGLMGGGRTEINVGILLPSGPPSSAPCCGPGRWRRRSASPAVRRRGGARRRAGAVHPVIDPSFALGDIADADECMETNANVGKILIDVSALSRPWRARAAQPRNR